MWPIEKHIVDMYLGKSGSVLDIACAAGRLAIPLSNAGKYHVVGFDISYNQVKRAYCNVAGSKSSPCFFQGDMSLIGLKSESFDFVFITYTSLGAMTELNKREDTLSEVFRLLRPNGMAFISVWNRYWPNSSLKWFYFYMLRLFGLYPYASGDRVCWESGGYVLWHYFSPFEAKKLFKAKGFYVIDTIPFQGSWENNTLVKKNLFTQYFAQGLYYVLKKDI